MTTVTESSDLKDEQLDEMQLHKTCDLKKIEPI